MRRSSCFGLFLAVATAAGCSVSRPGDAPSEAPPTRAVSGERALVVSTQARIAVADVEGAHRTLREMVRRLGGYVSEAVLNARDQSREARLIAHVPALRLPDLRDAFASVGDVELETEKVEDVTEQRVDLAARLRTARTHEARLLKLLEEKTGNLADVIAVEKELAGVRNSIERVDAQQQALGRKVDLATVTVTLFKRGAEAWKSPIASVGRAGKAGLEACARLLTFLGMALAASAPTLVTLALLALAFWRSAAWVSRWRRRRGEAR